MKLTIFLFTLFFVIKSNGQNVGIGTNTPQLSAGLEISSTTQGFLPPRMTLAERNAIANPVNGLVVYCTSCDELQVYSLGQWKNVSRGTSCAFGGTAVSICNQVCMSKNLDVTTYRNGDVIPQVSNLSVWSTLTTGAWCYYNNDPATGAIYGKLYNWYAVNDPRGIAPLGWHIPTNAEWTTLSSCLGGDLVAGGKMKETGTTHWSPPNTGADNSSGFLGLPGGLLSPFGYGSVNLTGYFWSSSAYDANNAYSTSLNYSGSDLGRNFFGKILGFSVRCLRD